MKKNYILFLLVCFMQIYCLRVLLTHRLELLMELPHTPMEQPIIQVAHITQLLV